MTDLLLVSLGCRVDRESGSVDGTGVAVAASKSGTLVATGENLTLAISPEGPDGTDTLAGGTNQTACAVNVISIHRDAF